MNKIDTTELVKLLKKEFEDKDGYVSWDRTIQRTIINDIGDIVSSVYRSNQSSIHYHYRIDMTATISDTIVQLQIYTETSASNGDPYCGRGMRRSQNNYTYNKSISEFNNNNEMADYISAIFYKHYFRIQSRN